MDKLNDNLQEKKKKDKRSSITFTIISIAMVTIVFLLFYLTNYVLMKVAVIGPSMETTLYDGDVVLINRKCNDVDPGDVVIINLSEVEGQEYLIIKRVIAVDECTVEIKSDGYVYVDGVKVDEPYLDGELTESSPRFGFSDTTWHLKDGEVFYLGDNRAVSADSRTNGTCTMEEIYGKVLNCSIKYRETFTKILG